MKLKGLDIKLLQQITTDTQPIGSFTTMLQMSTQPEPDVAVGILLTTSKKSFTLQYLIKYWKEYCLKHLKSHEWITDQDLYVMIIVRNAHEMVKKFIRNDGFELIYETPITTFWYESVKASLEYDLSQEKLDENKEKNSMVSIRVANILDRFASRIILWTVVLSYAMKSKKLKATTASNEAIHRTYKLTI